MSGEQHGSTSHATAWFISVLAAMVLYVLSIGPVVGLLENGTIPRAAERQLEWFYTPVLMLADIPDMAPPLEIYLTWWIEALAKPHKP
jgi:hypothetical protein